MSFQLSVSADRTTLPFHFLQIFLLLQSYSVWASSSVCTCSWDGPACVDSSISSPRQWKVSSRLPTIVSIPPPKVSIFRSCGVADDRWKCAFCGFWTIPWTHSSVSWCTKRPSWCLPRDKLTDLKDVPMCYCRLWFTRSWYCSVTMWISGWCTGVCQ